MNDPKRLLDDPRIGSDAGSLLRALRPAEPPSVEKQAELVQRMLASVAAPVRPPGWGVKTWLGAGALALVCGLTAAWVLWRRDSTSPMQLPSAPATAPTLETPGSPAELLPTAAPVPAASSGEAPPAAAVSGKPAARDTLAEEEALLEQARRALATSPSAALTFLRRHQQRFPAGQLTAERMFLSIDALRRAGDSAGAERQKQALLKRFPSSVYAGQLRRQATP